MDKKILLKNIDSIPALVKDFLGGEEYASHRFSVENILKQAEAKKRTFSAEERRMLCEVLEKQMHILSISDEQKKNLELLSQDNVFTVVTGHQLNLFSGPVFFVYKILQTIKTAEFLNQNTTDKKFVPLFWMATEDHDFDEINHFKTQYHRYQISGKSGGAVGRIKISENHFIKDFEREFKDDIYGTELTLLMKEAYENGKTMSWAIRNLVNRMFGNKGILIIDGDDVTLKEQMRELFSDELINQSLKNLTHKKIEFLEKKYGKVQVNPRDINLFYLSETRDRIEQEGDKYRVVDTDLLLTEEEILSHMEKISPNALMRPVYQEKILPNVAYIGGNAEVMYWLELEDYFREKNIPFPILVPRNSMLFLTEKISERIAKKELKIEDFFGDYTEIVKEKILCESELTEIILEKEKEIEKIFSELKEKSYLTDKTFRNLVEAEEKRQLKSYKRMKKRLLRAEKIKQNERYTRMNELFFEVHPAGIWQERVLNFSVFYAQNGYEWIKRCYEKIDVENSTLNISYI